ncbi:MAG: hypothetical protein WA988_16375 [Candidatus Nanopelagicales bacterium]|jgi:hypothetical protein
MSNLIVRADGSTIYGPGKKTARQVQHLLVMRKRAGAQRGRRRDDGKGSRSQVRRAASQD